MSVSFFRANARFLHLILVSLPLLACGNSPPLERDKEYPDSKEEIIFHRLSHDINVMQDDLSYKHEEDLSYKNYKHRDLGLRGFHAKSHGCLNGTLEVLQSPEPDTAFGIFKEAGKQFKILGRFSNGLGFIKPDSEDDVRGLAIKVLAVEGERVPPVSSDLYPEQHSQDFLMTNNPTQLASTAHDFMKFGKTQDSKFRSFLFLFFRSPMVLWRIWSRDVDSLVNEQYWSDAPIHLGTRTIKYTARPLSKSPGLGHGESYLTDDLRNYVAKNRLVFDFQVQFQLDASKQPMEDALTEWEETDTPFVTVARILFEPQQLKETTGCENLRFTPWHALAEHKPLGNMNRGRRGVYEASQRHRAASFKEPDEHSIDN